MASFLVRHSAETLRLRLADVVDRLGPAAERWEQDPEHVHHLRVAARRAVAALDLFRILLPRKRTRQLRDELHQARRRSDAARDCDVLIKRLAAEPEAHNTTALLERLRAERRTAQLPIIESYCQLGATGLLARQSQALVERVRWGRRGTKKREPGLRRFARRRLRKPAKRFFAQARAELTSVESLHKFRIRGKELRYSLELFRGALRRKPARRLQREITSFQDKLGAIIDRAVSQDSLRHLIDTLDNPQWTCPLQKLLAEEQPLLEAARQEFSCWWTPKRCHRMRKRFEALLTR